MVGFYINLCAFVKASYQCCAYLLLYIRIRVSYNIITTRNNGVVVEVELPPTSIIIFPYLYFIHRLTLVKV